MSNANGLSNRGKVVCLQLLQKAGGPGYRSLPFSPGAPGRRGQRSRRHGNRYHGSAVVQHTAGAMFWGHNQRTTVRVVTQALSEE